MYHMEDLTIEREYGQTIVRDAEGEEVIRLYGDITDFNLHIIIDMANRSFHIGTSYGTENVRASLRRMLGIDQP